MNKYDVNFFPWHILVDSIPIFQVAVMGLVSKRLRKALIIAKRSVTSMPLKYAVQTSSYLDRAIISLGFPKNNIEIFNYVLKKKNVTFLIHIINLGCTFNMIICWRYAIENGHINLLNILKNHSNFNKDYPTNLDIINTYHVGSCGWAAWHNQLEVLKWLRLNKFSWNNTVTCIYAAKAGNLTILKWLRSQNPPAPWCTDVCKYGASSGNLNVLKWLRSQTPPCPWDYGTILFSQKSLTMTQWILSQYPPCPLPPKYLFNLDKYIK